MSVYTIVNTAQLEQFLTNYQIGTLIEHCAISDGIENTNYFVTTSAGQYVLTVFEALQLHELPFFLQLMAFYAKHGIPCAHPVADTEQRFLRHLHNKPAAIVKRLMGKSVTSPSARHCELLGAMLGKMHQISREFPETQNNKRDAHWCKSVAAKLIPFLNEQDTQILQRELHTQSQFSYSGLPTGIIHADLFRDNVLFEHLELTGILDLYYACNGQLLYDVAVTINDWCTGKSGEIDTIKTKRFLTAYNQNRPLTQGEQMAWPSMLRAAALRFWLSRLYAQKFPREGHLTHLKNPDTFKTILNWRIKESPQLFDLWV